MPITTETLGGFVDRLTDLKLALAALNGAGTPDKHLLGLENVANAARALFDDDKQTTALRLFANPSVNADMEPMLETGNGGYAYMDELAKYRIYGLHDMFNYQSATFICHDGELWRCVQKSPHERNAALAIKHKLVPVSGEMRIFDAADYRKTGKAWPTASTSLKAGGWTASFMARSGTSTGESVPCCRLSETRSREGAIPKKKRVHPQKAPSVLASEAA